MKLVALKRAVCFCNVNCNSLLAAGVLGDGLGALADSVLSQFTGQEQTDGGLDLAAGDGGALVVVGKAGGFAGDALEQIVDEAVHDAHGLAGDTSVGVHLLHDLVHVDAVAFSPLSLSLLVTATRGLGLGDGLLRAFGAYFGRHIVVSGHRQAIECRHERCTLI